MSLKNTEIEFKYNAKSLLLSAFKAFCTRNNPVSYQIISGYDHFYSKNSDLNSFYRHRINTNENQLTFKRKTDGDNNVIREEHNIDLPMEVSEEKIKDLCGVHGYSYNTSIFKNCFIYNYSYYTLVFYVVYDTELKELDRFVEIEMKESHDWSSKEHAYKELLALEKMCRTLGISSKDRINKSLFELYKKE